MPRKNHTPEFKAQALSKVRQRGSRTLAAVAEELNLALGTLKGWIKQPQPSLALPREGSARDRAPEQRLLALQESYGLSDTDLHAWCRERGLFEYQLQQWRTAFCQSITPTAEAATELRALRRSQDQLQKDIRRKDKALAEAEALLILQKKFQALWAGEEK